MLIDFYGDGNWYINTNSIAQIYKHVINKTDKDNPGSSTNEEVVLVELNNGTKHHTTKHTIEELVVMVNSAPD